MPPLFMVFREPPTHVVTNTCCDYGLSGLFVSSIKTITKYLLFAFHTIFNIFRLHGAAGYVSAGP